VSFLTPLLLLGLGAIAVPVFVHLIQRERKRVVEFPSLMFVQKIPYQSVRRRRIRHWFLLLMRAAAIFLIVTAFARPFFPGGAAALGALGGSREVVILLDQSASMGYGDRWQRAKDEARKAIAAVGVNDRATLVLFSRNAEENMRATADRGRLEAALGAAALTAGATRYGPALKLAESILGRSTLQRKEAILITDFQKSGWTGSEDVRFGERLTLTPVSVASPNTTNLSVPSLSFARSIFSNQERVTVTAGVINRGAEPAAGVPVVLEIDGHQIEATSINVGANASVSVSFAPFTLAAPSVHGVVKAGTDQLAADNTFDFVLAPNQPVSVLIVDDGGGARASFYLAKALSIGATPSFQVETVPAARVTPDLLDKRAAVVINDTVMPPGLAGGALKRYVERGGGLLVALGEHAAWPASEVDLLPGKPAAVVNRTEGRGATIGLEYSHPVFEVFKAPRSGDFSAVRVFRYRALEATPDARVLARFDDGAVAAVEKRLGQGRVIAWTTSLDESWSDLPLKPVYLPLVHQFVRYLAQYEQPASWSTVGQVVDLAVALKTKADRVVVTPGGQRVRMPASEPGILELDEHGVYEIRSASSPSSHPDRIAVNLDPSESDLASIDPTELVAAVTGRAHEATATAADAPAELTPLEAERRQGAWWYLLVAGLVMLAAEMAVANRLSRGGERFN
jgi:hypothetical protein